MNEYKLAPIGSLSEKELAQIASAHDMKICTLCKGWFANSVDPKAEVCLFCEAKFEELPTQ